MGGQVLGVGWMRGYTCIRYFHPLHPSIRPSVFYLETLPLVVAIMEAHQRLDCIQESTDHLASYIQHWLAGTQNLVWPLIVTRFQPHHRPQLGAYGGTSFMVFSAMDTICKRPKLDG